MDSYLDKMYRLFETEDNPHYLPPEDDLLVILGLVDSHPDYRSIAVVNFDDDDDPLEAA